MIMEKREKEVKMKCLHCDNKEKWPATIWQKSNIYGKFIDNRQWIFKTIESIHCPKCSHVGIMTK